MAIKNNPKDELLRQRNKDTFHNAALYWNKLANERVFEIEKQLLAIALIVLPLSGSVVLADKSITQNSVILLVLGWFTLFISIITGFINLWIEANYFVYLSNDSSTREEIWSDSGVHITELDRRTLNLNRTKSESSSSPLIIQSLSLFIGVIFIMLVVFSLLQQDNSKIEKYNPKGRLRYFLHVR